MYQKDRSEIAGLFFLYILAHARTLCRHIYTYFWKKYKKVLAHYIYMRIIVKARPKRESEKSLKKMVKKN